jgi:hypothetical protein
MDVWEAAYDSPAAQLRQMIFRRRSKETRARISMLENHEKIHP